MKVYITIVLIVANLSRSGKVIENWKARRSFKIQKQNSEQIINELINGTEANRQCVLKKRRYTNIMRKRGRTDKQPRIVSYFNPTKMPTNGSIFYDPVNSKHIFNDEWLNCDFRLRQNDYDDSDDKLKEKSKRDIVDDSDTCKMMKLLGKPTYIKKKDHNDELLRSLAKLSSRNNNNLQYCGIRWKNREDESYARKSLKSMCIL